MSEWASEGENSGSVFGDAAESYRVNTNLGHVAEWVVLALEIAGHLVERGRHNALNLAALSTGHTGREAEAADVASV